MASDFAILTKSYVRDFYYCRDLCKSIDKFFPDIPHYLVIDFWDRNIFKEFKRYGRKIIYTEALLPEFIMIPRGKGRRTWISPYRFRPVGGWFIQQLAKIAAVSRLPYQAVVLTDSDMEFVRPITPDMIFQNGRTRMLRYLPLQLRDFQIKWNEISHDLLGIPDTNIRGVDYVENLVTWHPEVVRSMLKHLNMLHGSWKKAMLRYSTMSEYYYYGMFVEHVPGPHQDLVYKSSQKLCYTLHYDFSNNIDKEEQLFIDDFTGNYVGFGIQSNIKMPIERRSALSRKLHKIYQEKK